LRAAKQQRADKAADRKRELLAERERHREHEEQRRQREQYEQDRDGLAAQNASVDQMRSEAIETRAARRRVVGGVENVFGGGAHAAFLGSRA